jgi:LPXTG-site transpeptidase (sortase) family protein
VRDNFSSQLPKPAELQPLRSLQAKIWQTTGLILITAGLLVMGWGGWMFYQGQAELSHPPARIVEAAVEEEATATRQPAPTKTQPTATLLAIRSTLVLSPTPTDENKGATLTRPPQGQGLTPTPKMMATETTVMPTTAPTPAPATDDVPSLADNPLVMVEDTPTQTITAAADPLNSMPPAVAPPTRIVAESIKLDAPVVETGWKQMTINGEAVNVWVVADYAAGWHKDSSLPGKGGNVVLSGHHNIKGEVFRYIVDLNIGDIVNLYVGDQRYDYVVNDKFIVKDKGEPDAVRRANAKWIGPFNEERLTLVTCWPYNNNTHRVIVIAQPVGNK